MKHLSRRFNYSQLSSEILLSVVLYIVYFTRWDDSAFQNSPVVHIVRLVGVTALCYFVGKRGRNVFRLGQNSALRKLGEVIYVLALILFLCFSVFDLFYIKEQIYFTTHEAVFADLIKSADSHGCTPSVGDDYCAGDLGIPFELLYWTGRDKMFVIKDAGKLYIMLGCQDTGGFVYISDQEQIPDYIGVGYLDVTCRAKVAAHWFICDVAI
jgi:hypothetical protein